MKYTKVNLEAPTKEAILNDIRGIKWKGVEVYPDYPEGYELSFNSFERFVVTEPRQKVLVSPEFDDYGNQTKAAVLGNWECILVLPSEFDTGMLQTLIVE